MKSLPIILALLVAPFASAGTVFSNGSPSLASASASDVALGSLAFDDFTLVSSATIRAVEWWGVYFPNAVSVDNFTIEFSNDSAGTPGTLIASYLVSPTRVDTGLLVNSAFNLYNYNVTIPDTPLVAGTYWLSIFNNTTASSNRWYWATSASSGNATSTTGPLDVELAFRLDDGSSVPEPASLLLSAAGLAAVVAFRKRRSA
ncbi:MAG: PEP-CTERM sorting domain-containing protein [Acidobacteriota bacterium]